MPGPMTFKQFSKRNVERCESPNGFNHKLDSWSASDWMTATLGELGEAANLIKKLNRIRDGIPGNAPHETKGYLLEKLGDELADTQIYLDLLFQSFGLDAEECVRHKWNKSSEKIGYEGRLP